MPTPTKSANPLLRPFSLLWRGLSWLRTALLNLITLIIVVAVILAIVGPRQPPLPDKAPLLLRPSGILVDQYSYTSPSARLLNVGNEGPMETLVRDLVDTVDHAANDDRITGILLQLDNLDGGGLSKLQEIGEALERFQATGKPVVALADNYTQEQYFLASYADEIYLNELGGLVLTGMGVYRNYLKDAFDKLAVHFHVFKVGEFKDFVEPYTRNDMSAASREHNQQWLDALWQEYTDQVEQRRQLDPGTLTTFINGMATHLRATQGDTAQLALQHRLVDRVNSRHERTRLLIERFGADKEDEEKVQYIDARDYNHHRAAKPALAAGNVALIVASGTILDGFHPEGTIGSDSLSELIRKARQDDEVKALVLRIDSGGGSAFASEIIRQELERARDAGKPIVISMGSVAASGGYWIAMSADEVWATPTTITGSIGVFGLFPTLEQSLSKLGVYTDGVGTTDLAGAMRLDTKLPDEAAQVLQLSVEHIYHRFLHIVAAQRGSDPAAIDTVAQGRVWTGIKAQDLGLVDKIGYLNDAVAAAAQLAGLDQYHVKLIEQELSPQERLIRQMLGSESGQAAWQALGGLGGNATWLTRLQALLPEGAEILLPAGAEQLLQGKAPVVYALCLECRALD
jgi:protease-4